MSDDVASGPPTDHVSDSEEANADPLHAIEAQAAAQVDSTLRRLLVVDDESTIRLAISRFLRKRGYEVDVAESGTEALQRLEATRYALMLCDLRMPGLSGLEAVPQAIAIDGDLGIIMLTAVNDASSATDALSGGAFDYLTKPVELSTLLAAVERALERRVRAMRERAITRLVREQVALRTRELELEKLALRNLTVSIAETLINAMEAKDQYLRGHSHRVAALGVAIAREIGLDDATCDLVHVAGRLHDVGKIGIRESVLNKKGPLTDIEFAHVKAHVRIGMDILAPLGHLGEALRFIQDHHEHWDGTGYPQGLSGEDISIGGRVLTAADAFDALTSKRAYRDPMTHEATLAYLRTQTSRLVDPRIYDGLASVIGRGPAGGLAPLL